MATADGVASVRDIMMDNIAPGSGVDNSSRSTRQLGSLLSLLAVKDVFETVRPLLVKEKISKSGGQCPCSKQREPICVS